MSMKKVTLNVLGLIMLISFSAQSQNKYASYFQNLPFKMQVIAPPVFKNQQVSITEVGGVGDGITLNTEAFQKAMALLTKKGGGIF